MGYKTGCKIFARSYKQRSISGTFRLKNCDTHSYFERCAKKTPKGQELFPHRLHYAEKSHNIIMQQNRPIKRRKTK